MGKPSATEPWGWQLDGHHAIINYFVLGDQIVMTPFFAGSEPVIATSGKYNGTVILQDEQNKGLEMLKALPAQRKQAILHFSKPATTIYRSQDNVVRITPASPAIGHEQRRQLVDLIDLYVGNLTMGTRA